MRTIKKKGSVYRGWYKSRDAFTFVNEKHWEKNKQVPTWTQAERNKTNISVRNTLSQLHWLHHSVNTQHRQALIANIWWVWIYKSQTKVPPAPAPSCACLCAHCMTTPFLKIPSVYSLTPGQQGWWARITRALFLPTFLNHIYHLWSVVLTCKEGVGLKHKWVQPASRHPAAHQTLTLGSNPSLIRSIMADHMWKMCLTTAMPITATHKWAWQQGHRFYQSKPSIHLDGWAVVPTGSQSYGWCRSHSGWWQGGGTQQVQLMFTR